MMMSPLLLTLISIVPPLSPALPPDVSIVP
jgi:hypothetical protein